MNSTLALKKADYESEVGDFMGFGRGTGTVDDPTWSDSDAIKVRMDVASGLRRFYYCGHGWSFLKPFAEVLLPQGVTTVTLPDDFGGIDGGTKASLLNSSSLFLRWMDFVGPGRVVQNLAMTPSAVGIPRLLAQRPQKAIGTTMQRSELIFFPKTDQAYTLTFPYFVTPNYLLDPGQPFAYGGVEHHETILECCLAVAEVRRDNTPGVHSMEAQRLLAISMDIDRRHQPTNLGASVDHSDNVGWWDRQHHEHGWSNLGGGVTINGTLYT